MAIESDSPASLMALSYAPTNTAYTLQGAKTATITTAADRQKEQATFNQMIAPKPVVVSGPSPAIKTPIASGRIHMARLIRYTVTDPDAVLADKAPDLCILMGGTLMLNGTDDKGFLMDLAPKVAEKLDAHNGRRIAVEYEDDEGRTKTLKAVKLSQLDVVVEVLKSY